MSSGSGKAGLSQSQEPLTFAGVAASGKKDLCSSLRKLNTGKGSSPFEGAGQAVFGTRFYLKAKKNWHLTIWDEPDSVIQRLERVNDQVGEETEEVVFKHRARLYR